MYQFPGKDVRMHNGEGFLISQSENNTLLAARDFLEHCLSLILFPAIGNGLKEGSNTLGLSDFLLS